MTPRLMTLLAGLVLLILAAIIIPGCVRDWQSQRSQARTDNAQSDAASNSAGDAIGTVTTAGQREAGSEALSGHNAGDIRNAEGSEAKVTPAADLAGRKALCKRPSYANAPQCKGLVGEVP